MPHSGISFDIFKGLVIDLVESFTINARELGNTLMPGLKIIDGRTDNGLVTKQAGRYGLIRISNP